MCICSCITCLVSPSVVLKMKKIMQPELLRKCILKINHVSEPPPKKNKKSKNKEKKTRIISLGLTLTFTKKSPFINTQLIIQIFAKLDY